MSVIPPERLPGGRAAWTRDLAVTLLALAAVVAWDLSGLDLTVTRLFGDAGGFALRHAWWTERVLHDGARWVSWAVLGVLLVNIARPWFEGPDQHERIAWVLVTLACVIAVPALKRVSATSCPWDLQLFGGTAVYVPHWLWGLTDGGPGHCFPSGHAASAFGFLSGYFVLRRHAPGTARRWLLAVLVSGAVLGGTQTVRGAHHLSHTLWTAWVCWTLSWVLIATLSVRRRPAVAAASTP